MKLKPWPERVRKAESVRARDGFTNRCTRFKRVPATILWCSWDGPDENPDPHKVIDAGITGDLRTALYGQKDRVRGSDLSPQKLQLLPALNEWRNKLGCSSQTASWWFPSPLQGRHHSDPRLQSSRIDFTDFPYLLASPRSTVALSLSRKHSKVWPSEHCRRHVVQSVIFVCL